MQVLFASAAHTRENSSSAFAGGAQVGFLSSRVTADTDEVTRRDLRSTEGMSSKSTPHGALLAPKTLWLPGLDGLGIGAGTVTGLDAMCAGDERWLQEAAGPEGVPEGKDV
jgi:hypothetical protein